MPLNVFSRRQSIIPSSDRPTSTIISPNSPNLEFDFSQTPLELNFNETEKTPEQKSHDFAAIAKTPAISSCDLQSNLPRQDSATDSSSVNSTIPTTSILQESHGRTLCRPGKIVSGTRTASSSTSVTSSPSIAHSSHTSTTSLQIQAAKQSKPSHVILNPISKHSQQADNVVISGTSNSISLQQQTRKRSFTKKLKRKTSSSSFSPTPAPIPELPPLQVPEHYQDLVNLFDVKPSLPQVEEEHSNMQGFDVDSFPARPASQRSSHVDAPTVISNATLQKDDAYEYEYYDLDNNNLNNSYESDGDDNSIQPSLQASPNISHLSNFQSHGIPTEQGASLHTGPQLYSSTYSSQSSNSPMSQRNSLFSIGTSSSTSIKNQPLPSEKSRRSFKVRNMFSKSNRSSILQSSEFNFTADTSNVPNYSALERPSKEQPLPFSNRPPIPHFAEVDLGPTYKAQIVPVRSNSNNSSSLNPLQRNQTSHNNNSNEDELETLDFVPNLRPAIDNVGSRLRTAGVASPAHLMMTKSQYEKYLETAKEQSDDPKVDQLSECEEEDEDSDDENALRARRVFAAEEAKKEDFRMRMKQDAHLSIYRQKMTKLTGSQIGLSNLAKQHRSVPSLDSLDIDPDDSEEDYDDVPLGILKAHGFPNSVNVKTMKSQPNLLRANSDDKTMKSQPNLLRANSDDTPLKLSAFMYSQPENAPHPMLQNPATLAPAPPRPSTPEAGYLAMRKQSNINIPGFNSAVPMNRGLVGEIAKEEEAKTRRKSVLTNLSTQRPDATAGGNNSDSESIYGAGQQPAEIQAQLQQMMQMQTQILQQMAVSTPGTHTPSVMNVVPAAPKRNWSSFDIMAQVPQAGSTSLSSSDNSNHSFIDNQQRVSRPGHTNTGSYSEIDTGFKFPSTTMRVVGDEYESEEDEEDEEGWKELEERRKQLREMWKMQPTAVTSWKIKPVNCFGDV